MSLSGEQYRDIDIKRYNSFSSCGTLGLVSPLKKAQILILVRFRAVSVCFYPDSPPARYVNLGACS
jgi:hypothetical protein